MRWSPAPTMLNWLKALVFPIPETSRNKKKNGEYALKDLKKRGVNETITISSSPFTLATI